MSEPSKAGHAGESERAELKALADEASKRNAMHRDKTGDMMFFGPSDDFLTRVEQALRLAAAPPQPAPVEQAGEWPGDGALLDLMIAAGYDADEVHPHCYHDFGWKTFTEKLRARIRTTTQPTPGFAEGFEACREALEQSRTAIASLQEYALGGVVVENTDSSGIWTQYPVRDELLAKIDATIASLRSPAAPEGPKEVTGADLQTWLNGQPYKSNTLAERLLSKFTITPKVQS